MSKRLIGPQPMRITAENAAARILNSLADGKNTIVFPLLLALGARILHFLPLPFAAFFLKKFSFTVAPDTESPLSDSFANPGDNGSA
mgnify:CR=1 FL=1